MYTFLFVSADGAIPELDFAACEDDAAALSLGRAMLSRDPERQAVEVWSETRRLCLLERIMDAPAAG